MGVMIVWLGVTIVYVIQGVALVAFIVLLIWQIIKRIKTAREEDFGGRDN